MKRFENPTMNVKKFSMEIATSASAPAAVVAKTAAASALQEVGISVNNIINLNLK